MAKKGKKNVGAVLRNKLSTTGNNLNQTVAQLASSLGNAASKKQRSRRAKGQLQRPRAVFSAQSTGLSGGGAVFSTGSTAVTKSLSFAPAPAMRGTEHGLRVTGLVNLYDIGFQSTSASAVPASGATALIARSGGMSPTAVGMTPANGSWVSSWIQQLAGVFSRFRFKSLHFHYRPAALSTQSAPLGFVFAFVDDVQHPALATSASTFSVSKMDNVMSSFKFTNWESWDYECDLPQSDELYFIYGVGSDPADTRQYNQGAFGVALTAGSLSGLAASVVYTYGTLYMSFVLDLYDVAPIYSSFALPPLPSAPPLVGPNQGPNVRQVDDDEEKVRPATPDSYTVVFRPSRQGWKCEPSVRGSLPDVRMLSECSSLSEFAVQDAPVKR